MKFELKKSHIAAAIALALSGAAFTTAHAAVTITDGAGTSARIADAGYFASGGLGLSYLGKEFVNWDIEASNYTLTVGGVKVGGDSANEVGSTNPLGASVIGPLFGGTTAITANFGDPNGVKWNIFEVVRVSSPGHVLVQVGLTNIGTTTAKDVEWSVGIDPDQGRNSLPNGPGNWTHNVINATGFGSSVSATSLDGLSLTLANVTGGTAVGVASYIDTACCSPVTASTIFGAGQAAGYFSDGDYSINLGYQLGDIAPGYSSSVAYEYIMAVPEPETYAMLLAGLGLIGFSARRRVAV
jgi:hypothetical protein